MKHTIDFVGKRKIPFTISLCIIVIGIIKNGKGKNQGRYYNDAKSKRVGYGTRGDY